MKPITELAVLTLLSVLVATLLVAVMALGKGLV